MEADAAESELPPFTDFEIDDPALIAQRSEQLFVQLTADIAEKCASPPLAAILACLLPKQLIVFWGMDQQGFFELRLVDSVQGRIRSVAEGGFSLAKGATITLAERVKGRVSRAGVRFEAGSVRASKAVVTIEVDEITASATHFVAKGGKVRHAKALASVNDIVWS
jgi:hypothetical protein